MRAALEHGKATDGADYRAANRWFRSLSKARAELRREPDGGRSSLLAMLRHPSPWVRMNAAADLLGTQSDEAVPTLEAILRDDSLRGGILTDARMVLREWRAGRLSL